MDDGIETNESEEELVPIEDALSGLRIVNLPVGESWVGALILVKTQGALGVGGWSLRRTEGLPDEELVGTLSVVVEMLRDRIRFREQRRSCRYG